MATTLARPAGEQVLASPKEVGQARAITDFLTPSSRVCVESAKGAETMPPELSKIIARILRIVAEGGTVTVGSMPAELTTTTAARLLGISRPTLMKMIAQGELKATKVGSHSRLRTDDVLAVRQARLEDQRRALDELRDLETDLGI